MRFVFLNILFAYLVNASTIPIPELDLSVVSPFEIKPCQNCSNENNNNIFISNNISLLNIFTTPLTTVPKTEATTILTTISSYNSSTVLLTNSSIAAISLNNSLINSNTSKLIVNETVSLNVENVSVNLTTSAPTQTTSIPNTENSTVQITTTKIFMDTTLDVYNGVTSSIFFIYFFFNKLKCLKKIIFLNSRI